MLAMPELPFSTLRCGRARIVASPIATEVLDGMQVLARGRLVQPAESVPGGLRLHKADLTEVVPRSERLHMATFNGLA